MKDKYMFVVAHPDDEVLGAGAFIANAIRHGHQVHIVVLNADYEITRQDMRNDVERSHEVLGVKNSTLLGYKSMNFYNEDHRRIVEDIEGCIRSFEPDYVFTHFDGDIHTDHVMTSKLVQQAARLWQRHCEGHKIKGLYFMEVLSSTNWGNGNFQPDTYVEVSRQDVEKKIDALLVYKNVVRSVPHPRSVDAIRASAVIRGCEIGYRYAEAFQTVWRDNI